MFMFSFLKNCDAYGVPVSLHFGKWVTREKGRSTTFGTPIGGLITIICNACLVFAVFIYSDIMWNKKSNRIYWDESPIDWEDLA